MRLSQETIGVVAGATGKQAATDKASLFLLGEVGTTKPPRSLSLVTSFLRENSKDSRGTFSEATRKLVGSREAEDLTRQIFDEGRIRVFTAHTLLRDGDNDPGNNAIPSISDPRLGTTLRVGLG
jgi:hypothetical protein